MFLWLYMHDLVSYSHMFISVNWGGQLRWKAVWPNCHNHIIEKERSRNHLPKGSLSRLGIHWKRSINNHREKMGNCKPSICVSINPLFSLVILVLLIIVKLNRMWSTVTVFLWRPPEFMGTELFILTWIKWTICSDPMLSS